MRLGLVLLIALVGCTSEVPDTPTPLPPPSVEVGDLAPDFTLTGLDGTPFTLSAHRGEVVVVNFWATWCTPCLAEMPELDALHRELAGEGVQIVGISQDTGGTEEVQRMAERLGITYPLLPDPAFQISSRFGGIPVLPTTFFLDAEGRVVNREVGNLSAREVRALIAKAGGPPT